MKKLILPIVLTNLLLADCSPNQKQIATNLWQESQTMESSQRLETVKKAIETCSLSKIRVDFYLLGIEDQLENGEVTLDTLTQMKKDISEILSINNSLFISHVRNKNDSWIDRLSSQIANIEEKIETNQEKLNKLQAYKDNSGVKRAFGTGEKLMLPILFANGKSYVGNNNKTKNLLERIEQTIREDKNAKFTITGYASSRGGARGNKNLSEKRANNTKRYLEKYISKGHIDAKGKGESDLICNGGFAINSGRGEFKCNYGTEHESSSRRIEILRRK